MDPWSEKLGRIQPLRLTQGSIAYRERGSGPPIVFVHGFLTNAVVWSKVVPRIAAEARCISLELPLGAHTTPMPDGADLSLPAIAQMVSDAIEALELEDVTLVGIAAGGAICQLLVVDRPSRVGRLVLLPTDTSDSVSTMPQLRWAAFVPGLTRLIMKSPIGWRRAAKRRWEEEAIESFLAPTRPGGAIARDLRKALRDRRPEALAAATSRFGEFDRPVLIAWSPDDKLLPFEHGLALARAFPDARLERVDGSYTYVVQDQPEWVAELILEFIRQPLAEAKPTEV